jgi:hypothetical protein
MTHAPHNLIDASTVSHKHETQSELAAKLVTAAHKQLHVKREEARFSYNINGYNLDSVRRVVTDLYHAEQLQLFADKLLGNGNEESIERFCRIALWRVSKSVGGKQVTSVLENKHFQFHLTQDDKKLMDDVQREAQDNTLKYLDPAAKQYKAVSRRGFLIGATAGVATAYTMGKDSYKELKNEADRRADAGLESNSDPALESLSWGAFTGGATFAVINEIFKKDPKHFSKKTDPFFTQDNEEIFSVMGKLIQQSDVWQTLPRPAQVEAMTIHQTHTPQWQR